jgi:glycosyltransferase involved in cell wall biosynthesis
VIYADQRWIGEHGIGRFARHALAGLDYREVRLTSRPAAALDAWRLAWALTEMSGEDLFFSPGYNSPLFCRGPFLFTIHDLSHIYCPENRSPAIRLYYATVMRRACRAAAGIFTVSEFTRGQTVEWSGVAPEKVLNVGCGVDAAYCPVGDSYGLPFPYLLCVSNRKRHKNEFRVVEAFGKSGLGGRMRLVFTGETTPELARCAERHQVTAAVHFAGKIPEEKLPSLYRGAEALVFPSLYEGFGLPLLEAMACGTPAVTSNVTGMPEVAGDAALLVDPTSVEQIAEAMDRIVGDTRLRQTLRERGIARAAQFSWETTVARLRERLSEVASHVENRR